MKRKINKFYILYSNEEIFTQEIFTQEIFT